jgi:hypothetical protein
METLVTRAWAYVLSIAVILLPHVACMRMRTPEYPYKCQREISQNLGFRVWTLWTGLCPDRHANLLVHVLTTAVAFNKITALLASKPLSTFPALAKHLRIASNLQNKLR